jgi:probable rRNA maturation factor
MTQPGLQLSLQFADSRHRAVLPRHRVARWIRAALALPGLITVRIVDADEGRELNRSYRGKDHATNVLTFDYEHTPVVTADLVLCAPVVEAEAQAQGIPIEAHYAHLLVHGTLHAQGFDHEIEADAQHMEARESTIVTALGFADPYAGNRAGASPG